MKRSFTGPHCIALIDRITQMIRTAGQTTSREIARELEITPKRVNSYLIHMHKELRLIRKVQQHKGNSGHCTIWALGCDAVEPDDKADLAMEPIRLTVKAWDQVPARDSLVAALFGPARAQA